MAYNRIVPNEKQINSLSDELIATKKMLSGKDIALERTIARMEQMKAPHQEVLHEGATERQNLQTKLKDVTAQLNFEKAERELAQCALKAARLDRLVSIRNAQPEVQPDRQAVPTSAIKPNDENVVDFKSGQIGLAAQAS